eukprot:931527_1
MARSNGILSVYDNRITIGVLGTADICREFVTVFTEETCVVLPDTHGHLFNAGPMKSLHGQVYYKVLQMYDETIHFRLKMTASPPTWWDVDATVLVYDDEDIASLEHCRFVMSRLHMCRRTGPVVMVGAKRVRRVSDKKNKPVELISKSTASFSKFNESSSISGKFPVDDVSEITLRLNHVCINQTKQPSSSRNSQRTHDVSPRSTHRYLHWLLEGVARKIAQTLGASSFAQLCMERTLVNDLFLNVGEACVRGRHLLPDGEVSTRRSQLVDTLSRASFSRKAPKDVLRLIVTFLPAFCLRDIDLLRVTAFKRGSMPSS